MWLGSPERRLVAAGHIYRGGDDADRGRKTASFRTARGVPSIYAVSAYRQRCQSRAQRRSKGARKTMSSLLRGEVLRHFQNILLIRRIVRVEKKTTPPHLFLWPRAPCAASAACDESPSDVFSRRWSASTQSTARLCG